MLSLPPVLHRFPMVGVYASVDVYTIFRFNPTQELELELLKMLRECLFSHLLHPKRNMTATRYWSGQTKSFQSKK